MGLNLNDPTKRYFDIQMIETHVASGGVTLDSKTVNL